MSDLLERMRAKVAHGEAHRQLAVPIDLDELETLLTDLRDAENYIARLRVPLLTEFGTTDPELLIELFGDRAKAVST